MLLLWKVKDFLVVILNKTEYNKKLENMVKEGIDKGTYTLTEDNTLKTLRTLSSSLKRNFKEYDKLDDVLLISNQLARIYASAKSNKFSSVYSVNINGLKFWQIIDKIGTMT